MPVSRSAEIHRRVIAAGGPALLFTNVKGSDFPLVTNLFGTPSPRRAGVRRAAARASSSGSSQLAQTLLPPTPGELWGARDLAAAALRVGFAVARAARSGDRGGDAATCGSTACPCSPPGQTTAARSSPSAGLHRASRTAMDHNLGMYRMQVHGPRTTGMHWQIGKGGGFHHAEAERAAKPLPVTRLPRRPAGADPRRHRAAARERARADARLADRRRAAAAGPRPAGAAPARRRRRVRAHRRGAAARAHARRARSATTTATTRCSTTTRSSRSSRSPAARTRSIPATVVGKPRQEDFFIGDLLQELLSPLFPLVMPAVRAALVLRRNRLPLARRRRGQASATGARRWRARSASSARASSRSPSSCCVTDRAVDLKDFRATLEHVLARTQSGDRSLRLRQPLDGHARLHRPEGQRGLEGRLARPRRPGARAAARVQPRANCRRGVTDVRVFCPGCLVVGGAAVSPTSPAPRRASRRIRRSPDWPLRRAHRRAARAPRERR